MMDVYLGRILFGGLKNMNNENNNELPYDFDLHFDIKDRLQLVTEYLNLKSKLATMDLLIKHYKIDIDDLVKVLKIEKV